MFHFTECSLCLGKHTRAALFVLLCVNKNAVRKRCGQKISCWKQVARWFLWERQANQTHKKSVFVLHIYTHCLLLSKSHRHNSMALISGFLIRKIRNVLMHTELEYAQKKTILWIWMYRCIKRKRKSVRVDFLSRAAKKWALLASSHSIVLQRSLFLSKTIYTKQFSFEITIKYRWL